MKISVIIPTFNRKAKLIRTLDSIKRSTFPLKDFEVIIIDDGSSDDTGQIIKNYPKDKLNLTYYCQVNQGPAKARNVGVELAKAAIVLFCGDDTLFHKNLLKRHYELHKENKGIAVLGLCLWDEHLDVDRFMRYIAPNGFQYNYSLIDNEEDAGFSFFYTCNISLEKRWFNFAKFDTSFTDAAYEDIDLGYMLEKKGLKIHYCEDAIVYHSHKYDPESFYKRMEKVGKNAEVFFRKHKDLKSKDMKSDAFPGSLHIIKLIFGILAKSMIIKEINIERHWFFNIFYNKFKGILLKRKEY